MSERIIPNTFNDPGYERRELLQRVATSAIGEVKVARPIGIETALGLVREGRVAAHWEGPYLIVRRTAKTPPDLVA